VTPIEPGALLGRVRLRNVIGQGSTGTVYEGTHIHLGTEVAVKVMYPRPGHGVDDRNRFLREARMAARLHDPSIVHVSDYGEHGDACYVVMELVRGMSLEQFLEQHRDAVPEVTIIKLLRRVSRALRVAHAAGLVHRDLKPANIMIDRSGALKVADFGLARGSGQPAMDPDGLFNGTPAYMAPECATLGAAVDARADLYSLGVMAYELAFGRLPYEGTLEQVLAGHRAGSARFDHATDCSQRLLGIIKKLMASHPQSRVQSAEQLIQMLGSARSSSRPPSGAASPESNPQHDAGHRSSSEDFSSLARFFEGRFSGRFSEHPEGRVVHSTMRERVVVWALLAATLSVALAGFLVF
jgi:serine/threonine-protein kinase